VGVRTRLCSVGVWGLERLRKAGCGTVLAVFDRSLYLADASGHLMCLLGPAAEAGPLHLVAQTAFDCRSVAVATRWQLCRHCLYLGSLQFDLSEAAVWSPDKVELSRNTSPTDVAQLLRDAPVDSAAHAYLCNADITQLVDWRRVAMPILRGLEDWIGGRSSQPDITQLVGLGPGLTPSGDDLLGAMLITLHTTGQQRLRESLSSDVSALLARTHPISAAHLDAALCGQGTAALHAVVAALVSSGTLPAELRARLVALGARSGWEMLLGVIIALQVSS
jgi:hypothetical protein